MYKDRDYMIKDRFRQERQEDIISIRTIYRTKQELNAQPSQMDMGFGGPTSVATVLNCPPGLEPLTSVSKLYLNKRLDHLQLDTTGTYKGEIVNEEGDRIFLITTTTHFESDEVIHYGKYKKMTVKGKFCYGIINYVGVQVFQIYGDPERVVRIGASSTVWGEIQVIPGPIWDKIPVICGCLCCYYCCHCCRHKTKEDEHKDLHHHREATKRGEAEIRVVVLKKDLGPKPLPGREHPDPCFKHVYTLRGTLKQGFYHQHHNLFYRKNFDLKIYNKDVFDHDTDSEDEEDKEKEKPDKNKGEPKHIHIGRLSSYTHHEILDKPLPTLEIPQSMDVYDKITLMGSFFLFNLKL